MLIPFGPTLSTKQYLSLTTYNRLICVTIFRASWILGADCSLSLLDTHTPLDVSDVMDPSSGEIIKEADLLTHKPKTDILFILPRAKSSTDHMAPVHDVSIETASDKIDIVAYGPSTIYRDFLNRVRVSEPRIVESVPLGFSNAFGGNFVGNTFGECDHCPQNPSGRGYSVVKGFVKEEPAPQVWLKDMPFIPSRGINNAPFGLTPVGRSWSPRRNYCGTYDENWKRSNFPFLPTDYVTAFNNCAHPRLQLDYQDALNPIIIHGLSEEPIEFSFGVDRMLLVVELSKQSNHPALMPIDTIIIAPETKRIDTIWRNCGPLHWLQAELGYRFVSKEVNRA